MVAHAPQRSATPATAKDEFGTKYLFGMYKKHGIQRHREVKLRRCEALACSIPFSFNEVKASLGA
jgi:hypothetical protein